MESAGAAFARNGQPASHALKPPANLDDKPSLHDELLGCARDFAVVAPGEAEIAAWGRHLGVP